MVKPEFIRTRNIKEKYVKVDIKLWLKNVNLTGEQQEAVEQLIVNYIAKNLANPHIYRQIFVLSPDYISFLCLKKDLPRILIELQKIIPIEVTTRE
jgi:translation elongation factor EF-Ts